MFCDYATSSSVWLLLAVKLKPISWNVLKKERGNVIVSVEDMLFVFLVMQAVITTTDFFPLGSVDKWIPFLNQLTLNYIHRYFTNLYILVTQQQLTEHTV